MSLGSNKPRVKTVIKYLEKQRLTSTGDIMYNAFIPKSGVDNAFYPKSSFISTVYLRSKLRMVPIMQRHDKLLCRMELKEKRA
jgi:hypothetical protein